MTEIAVVSASAISFDMVIPALAFGEASIGVRWIGVFSRRRTSNMVLQCPLVPFFKTIRLMDVDHIAQCNVALFPPVLSMVQAVQFKGPFQTFHALNLPHEERL